MFVAIAVAMAPGSSGRARHQARSRWASSWLSFNDASLPPGSTIVVPRDVTPFNLRQTVIDVSQIFSQLAVSLASLLVISRQN